jgi:hypothetical protein
VWTDGSDFVGVSDLDFPDLLSKGMSISRCAKTPMALDLRHVPSLTDGSDPVPIFMTSRTPISRCVDIPMTSPRSGLLSSCSRVDVCAPAESSHAHAGAISSELLQPLRPLEGFCPSSPSDGEIDAFLAVLLLKQPLAESFWVFSNPVKILQWILPSNYRTQRVLFLLACAYLHT